jgi:ElaB/YqjD/DUF883 family membrane-anchored ribosome-binding protein
MTTQLANDRITGDLKHVMREAGEMMESTTSQKGEPVSEVRARLAAAIESAKATCKRLEEKTVLAAKTTDRAIRQHPYESIGVGFGLGLLIGVLVARKQ